MPTSTVTGHTNDGVIYYSHALGGIARLNATGTVTDGDSTYSVGIDRTALGRSVIYRYNRAFFYFDLAGLSGTISSVTLRVNQSGTGTHRFYAVEWSGGNSLAAGDYDSVFTSGSGASATMTAYSGEVASSGSIGYDEFEFNSDGELAVRNALDAMFKVALVSKEDYNGTLSISQDYLETYTFSNALLNKPQLVIVFEDEAVDNAVFFGTNF